MNKDDVEIMVVEKNILLGNNYFQGFKDNKDVNFEEEVEFIGKRNPKVIGYINDDSNDVGKVHFGILYFIETDASIIIPKAKEMKNGKLLPFDYIDKFEELNLKELVVEDWSKIAIGALKNYLGKI